MESFTNQQGVVIVDAIINVIQENTTYHREIHGAIGYGDHGINMNKAVTQAKEHQAGQAAELATGMRVVSDYMLDDNGGSLGPL